MCCIFGQTERGSACPFLFCEHLTGGRRLRRKDAFPDRPPLPALPEKQVPLPSVSRGIPRDHILLPVMAVFAFGTAAPARELK